MQNEKLITNHDVNSSDGTPIDLFGISSAAIRRGTLTSHSTAGVCAFTKVSGTETVFVAVNVRNSASTYTLPAGVSNSAWNNSA